MKENENTKNKSLRSVLVIWLYLIIIFNGLSLIFLFFDFSNISATLISTAPEQAWQLPFSIGLNILNIVFAIYLLNWKKWAFWGFCITGVITFVAGAVSGIAPHLMVTELVYPIIIYILLRPQWDLLD